MNTDNVVMGPERDPGKSAGHRRHAIRSLELTFHILGALALLPCGLFSGFGFLDSFEPGNGLAWKVIYGTLTCGFLVGAVILVRRGIKKAGRQFCRGTGVLRTCALAALTLRLVGSANGGSPDPLLASGEQALVGAYKLDNVLLAPGKLVVLPNSHPLFAGAGDTPEQAAKKGLLNAAQLAVLKRQDCVLTILADHSFALTNLPAADLTRTFTVKGVWSMRVYHVFETYGYRIALNCVGYKGPALHAKFINADKPSLPILQILYGEGNPGTPIFRFTNMNSKKPGEK